MVHDEMNPTTTVRGLAAFDLDGTLLRGPTVCEILAKPLGRLAEMQRLESLQTEIDFTTAREEMARWYKDVAVDDLVLHLRNAEWAPGALESVRCLQRESIEVALVSVTWDFAVAWFAEQLNISHCLGTGLSPMGEIAHVWGPDKAEYIRQLSAKLQVPSHRLAAIGDSRGDFEMLNEAELRIFVGKTAPTHIASLIHLPDSDLRIVAERILQEWTD
jgi:HAD superfamily phosphoserine phosphatase-like hydrolase